MIVGYEAVDLAARHVVCVSCYNQIKKFALRFVPLFQAEVRASDICASCGEKLQKEDGCPT